MRSGGTLLAMLSIGDRYAVLAGALSSHFFSAAANCASRICRVTELGWLLE